MIHAGKPLPANVLDALQRNDQIEAIKLLRQAFGLGLKEAKDWVDAYNRGSPIPLAVEDPHQEFPEGSAGRLPVAVIEAARQGNRIEAIKRYREHTGAGLKEAKDAVEDWLQAHPDLNQHAPGKVQRTSSLKWLLILFAIGWTSWYFFFRHA